MINFACFSPHPPLLLPGVGAPEDKEKVKKTIEKLNYLGKKLEKANPDEIIISSPHLDWGFNVPLFFLTKNFHRKINKYLIGLEEPKHYFEEGKSVFKKLEKNKKYALIASGDMSHCLKEDDPYGFQSDGPKYDKDLVEALKNKDIEKILNLDNLYPNAGECGLRSFCFLLGILQEAKINWQAKILSYEGPFGVGYLTVDFIL